MDALILPGADDKIIPENPAIMPMLKRGRRASYLFLITIAGAVIFSGAADTVRM